MAKQHERGEVAEAPSRVIGSRVAEIRRGRAWTQQQLAERCRAHGLMTTQSEVARVEASSRGRRVTVELWLVLALALDVPPLALLWGGAPIDVAGRAETSDRVRDWFVGRFPLDVVQNHDHYREHAVNRPATDRVDGVGATVRSIAGALDTEDRDGQLEAVDALIEYLQGTRKALHLTRRTRSERPVMARMDTSTMLGKKR